MSDLDQLLQSVADLRQARDASEWSAADAMSQALEATVRLGGAKAPIARILAHHWGCSARWVERMAKTATLFPNSANGGQQTRLPDVPFSRYVACSLSPKPHALLAKALEEDWTVRRIEEEVRGKPPTEGDVCPACGRPLKQSKHKHHKGATVTHP